jgi:hypothetical protein
MPILNPDLSDVDALIADGSYPAKIVAPVEVKPSKKTGNPVIWAPVEITVDGKTRKRTAFLTISGAGAFGFAQLLRAVNMDALADAYQKNDGTPKPPFDTDTLVGQEFIAQITQKLDDQGTMRDNISGYMKK